MLSHMHGRATNSIDPPRMRMHGRPRQAKKEKKDLRPLPGVRYGGACKQEPPNLDKHLSTAPCTDLVSGLLIGTRSQQCLDSVCVAVCRSQMQRCVAVLHWHAIGRGNDRQCGNQHMADDSQACTRVSSICICPTRAPWPDLFGGLHLGSSNEQGRDVLAVGVMCSRLPPAHAGPQAAGWMLLVCARCPAATTAPLPRFSVPCACQTATGQEPSG